MNKTKIEWTDATWNPVTGCTKVSEGCRNCYAERMAKRLRGMGTPGYENGFAVTLHPDRLEQPLHWKKPRMIFVCSMGDLFHEDVPFDFVDKVFTIAALCPQHTFQVLTKRPARMLKYFAANVRYRVLSLYAQAGGDAENHPIGFNAGFPLPNVWLGVTAENQATADERIPLLLQCPAAVRFVSVEPMLGPVIIDRRNLIADETYWDYLRGEKGPTCQHRVIQPEKTSSLDWVIVGGETGPGARPMDPAWARSVRDQCQAANVPFFFKQWGEWAIGYQTVMERERGETMYQPGCYHDCGNGLVALKVGKKAAGRLLDGREWNEMPELVASGP